MREQEQPERATEPGRAKQAPRSAGPDPGVERPVALILRLQRSIGNTAVARLLGASVQRSAVRDVLRAPGQPLAESTRKDMEARFGTDFSRVRLHTDTAARRSATELGARAYTSGHHIVVGPGGIDQHTLAHELTHVVQQRSGPVAGTDRGDGLRVSDPGDRFEREAEANATRVLRHPTAGHDHDHTGHHTHAPGVQRMLNIRQTFRRIIASRLNIPTMFAGPTYTPAADGRAGGVDSSAVLSPTATGNANSAANPSLPGAIRAARRRYPRASFKAGHLLNGDFGGSGQDARNLTILTARANSTHKRFDNRVKDALKVLWDIYDFLRRKGVNVEDQARFNYGIDVQVQTAGGQWGPGYPDNCIANFLNCSAQISGQLGLDAAEQQLLSANDQATLQGWVARLNGYLQDANNNGVIDNQRRATDSNPAPRRRRRRARAGASQ